MKYANETLRDVKILLEEAFHEIEERVEYKGKCQGMSTGFDDLDCMIGGLRKSSLTLLGGRPSIGKTALILNLARHVSTVEKQPVALFTFETGSVNAVRRMLVSGAKIDQNMLRLGQLQKEHWSQLAAEMGFLQYAPLFFDDTYLNFQKLADTCHQLKEKRGLSLVIIDDLQQFSVAEFDNARCENQPELMLRLKSLAQKLGVAILVTSQLSRAVEYRKNKRPSLVDFGRGARAAEGPDVVLGLYRDEYYYPETAQRGEAELIIVRQKDGPIGTVELTYEARTSVFTNKVHIQSDDA